MSYLEHLDELRWRLIYALLSIFLCSIGCLAVADSLFKLLVHPLLQAMPEQNQQLIYTSLPEAFVAYLKISIVAGLFISSPLVLYQIWQFIAPGLYKHEKHYALPFVFFASFFFIAGGLFCFLFVFPWGFRFFLSFSNEYIVALPKMSEYISFSLKMLLVFGLVFQLPILTFFLTKIGIITSSMMVKNRKYVILIIFVLAAVLTPPDVITQIMLALPLILLTELSIIIAKIVERHKGNLQSELDTEHETNSGPESDSKSENSNSGINK